MEPNRQERRAMKKLEKSTDKSGILKMQKEAMIQKAEAILNKSDEPFMLKEYNINIVPLMAFIVANVQNKDAIEHIEKRFYSVNEFKEMVDYQQIKSELSEDEIYLAKLSKNIDIFLDILAISKIDNESAMQTYISAIFEIAADYLTDIANENNSITLLSNANESKAIKIKDKKDRVIILAMLIGLFWGILEKFINIKAVKDDLGIDIDDSLVSLISNVITDSEQYIKWLKQSISFQEAIINSGDIECPITDSDRELILLKYKMAKQDLLYRLIKKNKVVSTLDKVSDLEEKLEINKTKAKEKADKLKKANTELQKIIKDKGIELDDVKKQIVTKDGEIKALQEEIDKLKADYEQTNNQLVSLNEQKQDKEVDKAKIQELQEEINTLQNRISQAQSNLDKNAKTINVLATKLNQANNKIQLLSK